jgi:hypothetical protein
MGINHPNWRKMVAFLWVVLLGFRGSICAAGGNSLAIGSDRQTLTKINF